jgi:ATP-dependent 26S proteasome regulatory subunit
MKKIKLFINKNKQLTIMGINYIREGYHYFEYPVPLMALFYHITKNHLSNKIKYVNANKNAVSFRQNSGKNEDKFFIVDENDDIKLNDDICLTIYKVQQEQQTGNAQKNITIISNDIYAVLKSNNSNIETLEIYLNRLVQEYEKYLLEKNKNKIYHFVYQQREDDYAEIKFSQKLLSNFEDENEKNYETFDTLCSDNKEILKKAVNRLNNVEYYKKTGNKRKVSFLFHGPYGCGKTSHVSALANYCKRHIIEVPLSRIRTNAEFEEILNLTHINEVKFKNDEIIILFDEIDQLRKSIDKDDEDVKPTNMNDIKINDNTLTFDSVAKKDDKLNIEFVLSRLDGVGNYNGLIIIGTTNHMNKLPPALCRYGRLTPLYFGYCSNKNIKDMIEFYYNVTLTNDQIIMLPNEDKQIAPCMMKYYIELYENRLDELIVFLSSYNNNTNSISSTSLEH